MTHHRQHRVLVVLGAVVAALAVWAALGPIAGLDLQARSGARVSAVGAPAVALTSLLAGLAGWGVLAILERTVARPALVWRLIATVVYLISLLGPIGAATSGSAAAALLALHTVVAAVLIALLPRR